MLTVLIVLVVVLGLVAVIAGTGVGTGRTSVVRRRREPRRVIVEREPADEVVEVRETRRTTEL